MALTYTDVGGVSLLICLVLRLELILWAWTRCTEFRSRLQRLLCVGQFEFLHLMTINLIMLLLLFQSDGAMKCFFKAWWGSGRNPRNFWWWVYECIRLANYCSCFNKQIFIPLERDCSDEMKSTDWAIRENEVTGIWSTHQSSLFSASS